MGLEPSIDAMVVVEMRGRSVKGRADEVLATAAQEPTPPTVLDSDELPELAKEVVRKCGARCSDVE